MTHLVDGLYLVIDHDRTRIARRMNSGCWVSNAGGWVNLNLVTPAPNQFRVHLKLIPKQAEMLANVMLTFAAEQEQ